MTITHTKTFQGAWRLTTVIRNVLITKQYFGYSLKEAKILFREYVKATEGV